jgi:hypothetical protein
MKLQLQTIASLALLSNRAIAQLLSSNTANLIAWKSYGDIVKDIFTARQPLEIGTDHLFITPPTTVFIRGGSPCPEAVTNFDLFDCADSLQKPGDPLLDFAWQKLFQ